MVELTAENPWPGPVSYRTEDAAFFRGRSTEVEELAALVERGRSMVLFGASGLGKTSLIHAGLIPRLEPGKLFPVPIRISYVPGAVPVTTQIFAEIMRVAGHAQGVVEPTTGMTVWEYLHLREPPLGGAQPLLIFDQFEELFTIGARTPQATQLIEELTSLIEGSPPWSLRERLEEDPTQARKYAFNRHDYRVLLSVREDFLYGLEALRAQIPSIIHNRYRLGALSGARALEVVLQSPANSQDQDAAEAGGATSSPVSKASVAKLIVQTVAAPANDQRPVEELEVEPVLLSIMCAELARRRQQGSSITPELVTGTRADIIAAFYERALSGLSDAVRDVVEEELVTTTGFRTSALHKELIALPGMSEAVISELVDRRLLRVVNRSNGRWVELTHDILSEVAARSRERRRIQKQERAARALREQRLRTWGLIVFGAVLAAAVVFYGYYAQEKRSRDIAVGAKRTLRELLIDASLREHRYRDALGQLSAAVKDEPDAAWARALIADLLQRRGWSLPLSPLFPDGPFTFLACNRKGSRCAAAYRDGSVLIRGDVSLSLKVPQTGFSTLDFNRDGDRLLSVSSAGDATMWSIAAEGATQIHKWPVGSVWWRWDRSDDLNIIALPERPGELTIRNLHEGTSRRVKIRGLAFAVSADGAYVAYQSGTTEITLEAPMGGEATKLGVPEVATYIGFDPASRVLLAALPNRTIQRWRTVDGSMDAELQAPRSVNKLVFDQEGKHLIGEFEGGGLAYWAAPWYLEPKILLDGSADHQSIVFAPTGEWFAAATKDGWIRLWNTRTAAPIAEPIRLRGTVLAAPTDDHRLTSVSVSGTNGLWTVPTEHNVREYTPTKKVRDAWFTTNDTIYALGAAGKAYTWSLASDEKAEEEVSEYGFVSRDRQLRAANTFAGAKLYKNGDKQGEALSKEQFVAGQFSADGKRLMMIIGSELLVFDTATAKPIGRSIRGVTQAWLSPDGQLLATVGNDTALTIWNVGPEPSKRAQIDEALVVTGVAFDRQTQRLAILFGREARLWSLSEDRFVGRVMTHDGWITGARFSPSAKWLVTTSTDRTARLWDASSGLTASDWFVHGESVRAADFDESGQHLLTLSGNSLLRVWRLLRASDATDAEALVLARLAEYISGINIDPETNEIRPAKHAATELKNLHAEVQGLCKKPSDGAEGCTSALVQLMLEASTPREPEAADH